MRKVRKVIYLWWYLLVAGYIKTPSETVFVLLNINWTKTKELKLNIRYIIPFFIVFSLLTIEGSSHSNYNILDYYRTAEYVHNAKTYNSSKNTCHYCQFLSLRNNFQYFIYSLKKQQEFYNQQIENTLNSQTDLYLKKETIKQIYPKPKKPGNSSEEHSDLYRGENLVTRFCPTCNFLHALIDNNSNNLSSGKCINQTIRIIPSFNLSNYFFTG